MAKNRRKNKKLRSQQADLLLSDEDVRSELGEGGSGNIYYKYDRENVVSRMTQMGRDEAKKVIEDRYLTAYQPTLDIRQMMDKQDKQYKGIWQDDQGESEDRIFVPKTREEVNAVRNFILNLVSKLDPLVRFDPTGTDWIYGKDIDYKAAQVAQALFHYDVVEINSFLDDEFIIWLTHYLKYDLAVLKCVYKETDWDADLQWKAVDRGLLYLDPYPQKFDDLRYILEEYYLPIYEVESRLSNGDWFMSDDELANIQTVNLASESDYIMDRIFGRMQNTAQFVQEDELVKCFNYWQPDREGLPDVFATIAGDIEGPLVRFGRNPYPYKGIPYIAATYNPDDRPDGEGLVNLLEPFQKVTNTYYNLRATDVTKNITAPNIVAPELVDEQTMQDLEDGQTFVRAAEEFSKKIQQDPSLSMQQFMAPFGPRGTSTIELLTHDLPFVLSMSQNTSNVTDVMKGLEPQPGEPLGSHQERLVQSAANFFLVTRQVMRIFEKMAGVNMTFYKDPVFYPTERIVRIIGRDKYKDVVDNWHKVGDNTFFKSVTADEMAIDVTFNARAGADAQASKTLFLSMFNQLMQSIGQNPEMVKQMMQNIDFSEIFMQTLNVSGIDTEAILLTDKEKKQRAQQAQQAKQAAMQDQQMQMRMKLMFEQAKQKILTQGIIAQEKAKSQFKYHSQIGIDEAKGQMGLISDKVKVEAENDAKLEQIITQIVQQKLADMQVEMVKGEIEKDREDHEAELEKQAGVDNVSESGGGNIQQPQ